MTTDELREKFEVWWQCTLQSPTATSYNSDIPAEGDYRGVAWLAYQAAHASRDAEVEALMKDAERWRWSVSHAAWHRDDGRTFMAIEAAPQADLSSVVARTDAIDAAMREESK